MLNGFLRKTLFALGFAGCTALPGSAATMQAVWTGTVSSGTFSCT